MEELGVIGQIVLFAIIIIASVVQQVVKNKQKKRISESSSQGQASRENGYGPANDYYDDEAVREEGAYRWGSDGEAFLPDNYESPGSIREPAPYYGYGDADKDGSTESNSSSTVAVSTYANADDDAGSLEDLIGKFDLRRAVIYSELLNPKFEE